MFQKNDQCIDVGAPHCPCGLAAFEQCITCSRLAGKDKCECSWQGVCVYNEYIQNGGRIRQQRKDMVCRILKKTWYEKDLAVMRIQVPAGFALKASLPGSCVFVRPQDADTIFDTPISVMRASHEKGYIELAVKASGVKTEALLQEHGMVHIRGIYGNGLSGVEKLLDRNVKKVLCITKGIGLAPAINYCIWAEKRSHMDFLIDPEKINRAFVEDCLSRCKVDSAEFCKLPLDDVDYGSYDAVLLCASDYYQEHMMIPEEKRVVSNNITMCCGEGICGACVYVDDSGISHKLCKCRKQQK